MAPPCRSCGRALKPKSIPTDNVGSRRRLPLGEVLLDPVWAVFHHGVDGFLCVVFGAPADPAHLEEEHSNRWVHPMSDELLDEVLVEVPVCLLQ